jgi:hypothetical protein
VFVGQIRPKVISHCYTNNLLVELTPKEVFSMTKVYIFRHTRLDFTIRTLELELIIVFKD